MVICCHHGHFPNHSASLRKVSKMFKERWFQTTYTLLASKSLTIFFVPQIFSALRVPVSRIPLRTLVQNTDSQRWGRSCQGFYILAEERVTCKLTNKVSSESGECNEEWQDNTMTRKTPSWGTSDAQPAGMEAASPTKAKLFKHKVWHCQCNPQILEKTSLKILRRVVFCFVFSKTLCAKSSVTDT